MSGVKVELTNLLLQLLTVQPEFCGRFGNVALVALKRPGDELPLKGFHDLLLCLFEG